MSNANSPRRSLPPILPVGTRVVASIALSDADAGSTPAGSFGVVIGAPASPLGTAYRVKFANGFEASLQREHFRIHSQIRGDGVEGEAAALGWEALEQFVIFRCVVGSRAFGLDTDDSDTDRRGIYLPPAELHWSMRGVPEQLDFQDREECYWELEKFMRLALRANPNVLECLNTPMVEFAAPVAERLLAIRHIFLSKHIFTTFDSYVMSQFKKMTRHLENHGHIRAKHAMHLIRLLHSGIAILRDGAVPVRVEGQLRERLLSIKRSEMPWDEVEAWRVSLHAEFERAFESTKLPEHPDFEAADRFLIEARREMVK